MIGAPALELALEPADRQRNSSVWSTARLEVFKPQWLSATGTDVLSHSSAIFSKKACDLVNSSHRRSDLSSNRILAIPA